MNNCKAHGTETIDIAYHEKSMDVFKKSAKATKQTSSKTTTKEAASKAASSTSNKVT